MVVVNKFNAEEIENILADHFNCDKAEVSVFVEGVSKGYGPGEHTDYVPVATVKSEKPLSILGPRHSYWQWWEETISTPDAREYEYGWRCSRCETEPPGIWDDPFDAPELPYCPFCGEKMDKSIARAQVEDHIETAKKRMGEKDHE